MRILPPKETIGVRECPLFYRWTLRPWGTGHADVNWKLMVHRFSPRADDRDPHDHPRAFWTLVLWGYYDDLAPCDWCEGTGNMYHDSDDPAWRRDGYCQKCASTGFVVRERMRPGMLRMRPATHTHRTRVGPKGCWTIVLMGPLRRPWGFWRRGRWWSLEDYERTFGPAMRCEEPNPTHKALR